MYRLFSKGERVINLSLEFEMEFGVLNQLEFKITMDNKNQKHNKTHHTCHYYINLHV